MTLAQKSLPNKQKVLKLSLSPEQWECTIVDHSLQHITTHRYRRLWDLPEVRWRGFSASISAAARSNRSHPPQSCPEMWKAGLFDHTTQMGVGREESCIFCYLRSRSATLSNPEMRVWTLISRFLAMFSFLALSVLAFLRNFWFLSKSTCPL